MLFRSIVSLIALSLLAGCEMMKGKENFVSPEEFAKTAVTRQEARALRAGDEVLLVVEVNGQKEVPVTKLQVDYVGAIPAPLVGDAKVEGLTLAEARAVLEKKYSDIFVAEPLITLRMGEDQDAGEWGYITVLGQVRNPGRYSVLTIAGMNLSDALHEAGGFADSANMNKIVITRKTQEGALIQCRCDIRSFGKVGSTQHDLTLFDGDVVFVPERVL